MDWNVVVQAITTVGFPIVMCGALFLYMKDSNEKHRQEIAKLNETHKEEVLNLVKAVDNNTLALTKLCEQMN